MPLYLTQSHSSRVSKTSTSTVPAALRRSLSSPLASAKRTKSLNRTTSLNNAIEKSIADGDDEDYKTDSLWRASGKTISIFNINLVTDVTSAIRYATTSMFSSVPDRAGMNSTCIAELLNFHKGMPPIVSLAHIYAIISASSKTEREIQSLMSTGRLRKIRLTGRGDDVRGLRDIMVLSDDYDALLQRSGLEEGTTSAFRVALGQTPRASSIPVRDIGSIHCKALLQAGFLVSSSFSGSRNLSLSGSSHVGAPVISRAASGTVAAVGGGAAFETLGGVGVAKRSSDSDVALQTGELALSIPNIGPYLRLLDAGRNHIMELLRMSKHNQAPLYLLRERWEGAVDSDSRISAAKQLRGEFSHILPAKTKKWRNLNGLNFDWALEECLGSGMIELFETHSVGLGVKAII